MGWTYGRLPEGAAQPATRAAHHQHTRVPPLVGRTKWRPDQPLLTDPRPDDVVGEDQALDRGRGTRLATYLGRQRDGERRHWLECDVRAGLAAHRPEQPHRL